MSRHDARFVAMNYDNEDDENENMMDEMKMKMNENMNGKMMET